MPPFVHRSLLVVAALTLFGCKKADPVPVTPVDDGTAAAAAAAAAEDFSDVPAWAEEDYIQAYLEGQEAGFGAGQDLFAKHCAPCHQANGSGGIGPNHTDDCYLHGGTFKDIERTITDGVGHKGMIAWGALLRPGQIHDLVLRVRHFRGDQVEGGKECQGDHVGYEAP